GLPSAFRSSNGSQEDNLRNFWEWTFHEKNTSVDALIRSTLDDQKAYSAQIAARDMRHDPKVLVQHDQVPWLEIGRSGTSASGGRPRPKLLIQTTRLGNPVSDAELYNQVSLMADGEEKILELMRIVEPRLQKLRYS